MSWLYYQWKIRFIFKVNKIYKSFENLALCSSKLGYAYYKPDGDEYYLNGKYNNWTITDVYIY